MNNLLDEDDLKNKKFFEVVGTFSDKDFIFKCIHKSNSKKYKMSVKKSTNYS